MTYDPFTDALGVYVGPAKYAEVVKAISEHSGVLVVQFTDPDDNLLWHESGGLMTHHTGWSSATIADDDDYRSDVFVIGGKQEPIFGDVLVFSDVTLVLELAAWFDDRMVVERYTGGVKLHTATGTLTIVMGTA